MPLARVARPRGCHSNRPFGGDSSFNSGRGDDVTQRDFDRHHGPTVRAVLDAAGYHNVLTKVIGSNNPHNVVKAVFEALQQLESPEGYANRVGRPVEDIIKDYTVGSHVWGGANSAHA